MPKTPRDRSTLTSGQWEHLGSLIGDFLWGQEKFHIFLVEYLLEQGMSNRKIEVLADETFNRLEVGFQRKEKS